MTNLSGAGVERREVYVFDNFKFFEETGAHPAHRPVGPGLQIFCLITLPLVINYALLG